MKIKKQTKKDITEKEFLNKLNRHLDKTRKNVFTFKVIPSHRKKLRMIDYLIDYKVKNKEMIGFDAVDFVVQDKKFYHIKDFLELKIKGEGKK